MHKVKVNPTAEIVAEDIGRIGDYSEEGFGYVLEDFLIDEGVVAGLEVIPTATPSMAVSILSGRIYQERRQGQQDEQLTPPLVIVSNTSSFPRIDRVIARYQAVEDEPELRNYLVDVVTREVSKQEFKTRIRGGIAYQLLEGTPSPVPAPPSVPEGWLPLAQVKVGAGVVQILEADIVDERQLSVRLSQHNHDGRYSKPDHKHGISEVNGLPERLAPIPKTGDVGKVLTVKGANQVEWMPINGIPVGGEILWPTNAPLPSGCMDEHHQLLKKSTYSECYKIVGDYWTLPSDPTDSFRLPETRGEFLRFWDAGRGIDPDREIGSEQGDAIRNIEGTISYFSGVGAATGTFKTIGSGVYQATGVGGYSGKVGFSTEGVVPTANENRPRNIVRRLIIKVTDAYINPEQVDIAKVAREVAECVKYTDFTQNFSENGWTQLPNGLILQWGANSNHSVKNLFPIAFPNRCFGVSITTVANSTSIFGQVGTAPFDKFGFTNYHTRNNTGTIVTATYTWFAIGY